ncbi:MAG TPA: hypothetical protein PKD03_14670 [Ignavibacteriaceae bacterium]|nr:hypothetical protein [Ignavibacteriaceae bacterium]
MKIFITVIALFIINSNTFSQEFTQEEIDIYISELSNSDKNHFTPIYYFIKHNVVEALPTIEQYFWQQSCENQQYFLDGLYFLGSSLTHQYTLALFDSLSKPQKEKYDSTEKYNWFDCHDVLSAKVDCIKILYSLGDYSKTNEVFELIERDNEEGVVPNSGIHLLTFIIRYRPDLKEQAKQELMKVISTATDDRAMFSYSLSLSSAFDEEEIPEIIQIFKNSSSPQVKRALMEFYFSRYEDKFDLNGLVKESLLTEPNGELRLFYVKVLLLGFATPSDYEFIKNYYQNENNDTIKSLIQYEINSFIPAPIDTAYFVIDLLNNLTNYIDSVYSYNWLGDLTFSNELKNILTIAKTNLQNGDSLACRVQVKAFQDLVDNVCKDSLNTDPRFVTIEGWKFLYWNAQYILDRLPEPPANPSLVVSLKNSLGNQIPASNVMYYESAAGGWKDAVNNGDGTFTVITTKPTVSVRMFYEGANQTVNNVPAQNNTYTFQTVNASVQLKNSSGNLIDQGTVQYYAGAWRTFGTTVNGVANKELLPINYSFRMIYEYVPLDKQQDISTNSTVTFSTVLCTVKVTKANGQPLSGASTKYYSGAWRDIGLTNANGEAAKELLPKSLNFRAASGNVSKDKQQDIGVNNLVEIQLNVP